VPPAIVQTAPATLENTFTRSSATQGEEIKGKIASFPRGRYQFDLKGNLTPLFEEY